MTTIGNSYLSLPDRCYVRQRAETVPEPTLLAWNAPLAETLDLSGLAESDFDRAEPFSGNRRPDKAEPIALAYAGHQFGHFVPQLGDGKSAIGPVLREYVVSEAMHRLGVPTSRALAAVATGETVRRERPLPGAVLTRVAASHLRVGAFMDEFRHDKVFSSIDRVGRYAYHRQPGIAQWNLARFAECLLLIDDEAARYELALEQFMPAYRKAYHDILCAKLGLPPDDGEQGEPHSELIAAWLQHLEDHELDFTLSFRQLADRLDASPGTDEPRFGQFERRWREAIAAAGADPDDPVDPVEVRTRMNAINPLFIPRNHQIERAIDAALGGDLSIFEDLLEVTGKPYEDQPALARYAVPPAPHERVTATFCGT